MTYYGMLFSDELKDLLINEAVVKQSQLQMSVYYKYSPDGTKIVVSSYVDNCFYWYISEAL